MSGYLDRLVTAALGPPQRGAVEPLRGSRFAPERGGLPSLPSFSESTLEGEESEVGEGAAPAAARNLIGPPSGVSNGRVMARSPALSDSERHVLARREVSGSPGSPEGRPAPGQKSAWSPGTAQGPREGAPSRVVQQGRGESQGARAFDPEAMPESTVRPLPEWSPGLTSPGWQAREPSTPESTSAARPLALPHTPLVPEPIMRDRSEPSSRSLPGAQLVTREPPTALVKRNDAQQHASEAFGGLTMHEPTRHGVEEPSVVSPSVVSPSVISSARGWNPDAAIAPPAADTQSAAMSVHVHIGRVEVRAVMPLPEPPPSVRPEPALSLQDYLAGRRGRGA